MQSLHVDQLTVTTAGVLVAAVGTMVLAIQIGLAKRIARGQNTMPFLMGEQIRKLREAEKVCAQGLYDPAGREQLSRETIDLIVNDKDLRAAVKAKLNYYEAICCAMRRGTFDRKLFQSFSSQNLRLQVWLYVHYIEVARRDDGKNAYEHLIWVARRWDRHRCASHRMFDRKGRIIVGKTWYELEVSPGFLHRIFTKSYRRSLTTENHNFRS